MGWKYYITISQTSINSNRIWKISWIDIWYSYSRRKTVV